jgi:hypothetical protein
MIALLKCQCLREKERLTSPKMTLLKEVLIYKISKIHLDRMFTAAEMKTKDFITENKNNVLKIIT